MKKIFAVKTYYLSKAIGKAKNVDKDYEKGIALVEERVVIFKAKSFDEAIRLAEKEAKKYASYSYINNYGQKIKTKYLKACDAFEPYDDFEQGGEVYSSTHIWKLKEGKKSLLDSKMGKYSEKQEKKMRKIFLNQEFGKL